MKRIFSILTLFVVAMVAMADVNVKFDVNAYRAEMHQYVTKEANLTQQEAQKFFSIYDEMRTLEREIFKKNRKIKDCKPMTEAEIKKVIMCHDKNELKLKQIQMEYHEKLLNALPAKKVFDALVAADKFDKMKFRSMMGGKK